MNRKVVYFLIGIIAVILASAGFIYAGRPSTLTGAIMNPPWPAPEMELVSHDGTAFSMSGQRGRVVLLYFGFVNCPDECPLTMAHLKLALESLGTRAEAVEVVMVSTDPARDTPQALGDFMGKFGPAFMGLTGSQEALEKVWRDYGVTVEEGGETHSTYIYVIDTAGDIRETFLPDSDPADIANDVGILLKAGAPPLQ
jgi:protein SCO1/2